MGKILPILLILIGVGVGGAAGFVLRPKPPEAEAETHQEEGGHVSEDVSTEPESEANDVVLDRSYVKMNNQFVIPVIKKDKVVALVVMSISLETKSSETADVYDREPKLRDAFLQVMFDHSYMGGFDGVYTAPDAMNSLRRSLLLSAQNIMGSDISDALITEIIRQDL